MLITVSCDDFIKNTGYAPILGLRYQQLKKSLFGHESKKKYLERQTTIV